MLSCQGFVISRPCGIPEEYGCVWFFTWALPSGFTTGFTVRFITTTYIQDTIRTITHHSSPSQSQVRRFAWNFKFSDEHEPFSEFNEEVFWISNVAKKYWVVTCASKCRFGTSFRRARHVHSHICNSPLRNVGFGRSVDGNVLFLLALLRLYERNWALQFWVCANLGVSSVSSSQISDLYSHVSNFITSAPRYYSYPLTQHNSGRELVVLYATPSMSGKFSVYGWRYCWGLNEEHSILIRQRVKLMLSCQEGAKISLSLNEPK